MKTNKRTTMADIAKHMGISKNAVSLALRQKPGVSERLRASVIEMARKMEYEGFAQPPPTKGRILALIPHYLGTMPASPFYRQVCFYLEHYAQLFNYELTIDTVTEQQERDLIPPPALDMLICTGIITVGYFSQPYCQMINSQKLRYVMVDQCYDELIVDCVTSANLSGAYMLTRHLIKQGHRQIEYFGKRHTTSSLDDRWLGYCRAMHEFHLPIRENLYQHNRQIGQRNDAQLIRQTLRNMPQIPTAVLCGHDHTAIEFIRAADEMGYKVPEDISVVGFDNIQSDEVLKFGLTTFQTDREAIARSAMDLFNYPPINSGRRILITGECVFRQSVKNLNEGEAIL